MKDKETMSTFSRIVFGTPLTTYEESQHRLTKVKALAVFSSDALSSVAYAPEEILLVLVAASSMALGYSVPIALVIVLLLAIVTFSYYQTIHGYPSGGGAYIVAHTNLGQWPGLTAAAALLIGYVLTVSVSIAAGMAAITSLSPDLLPYRVLLALLAIVLITWANLRGVKESGTVFSVPTYLFIAIFVLTIVVGLMRLATGTLSPVEPHETLTQGAEAISLLLVLRAFAAGTAALTGVEAISNGIPAFQKPEADNAGKTLISMAVLLGIMFLGVTLLARGLNVVPHEHQTVVSQVGRQVFGDGPLYVALQAATALILILAANTSYADFPRLSAILARDRYLPRQLANVGDRLVFANGILLLALLSGALIIIFGGSTHALIPLYAIGVFLAFTLSQLGMVRHWQREKGKNWQLKATINGIGALATAIVTLVVGVSRFAEGAWIVMVLIPAFVWMFHKIREHYLSFAEQLSLEGMAPREWFDMAEDRHYKVIIPVSGMHRGTLKALRFARNISADVVAVTARVKPESTAKLEKKWKKWGHGIPLIVLEAPYRSVLNPLMDYVHERDAENPERGLAVIVIQEFVPARSWHRLLHNQMARAMKQAMLYRRGQTGEGRIVIDVPYHLHH